MKKIYADAGVKIFLAPPMAIPETNAGYYIGYIDKDWSKGVVDVKYDDSLVSEAAIGSQPHSVVLLRLSAGQTPKDAVEKLKKSVDGWKWICVGGDVIVDNIGNLVLIIIEKDTVIADKLHQNFKDLAK